MEILGFNISEVERNPDIEWVDLAGKPRKGPVIIYQAKSKDMWAEFRVSSDLSSKFTTITMTSSKPENKALIQLTRKSDVYEPGDKIEKLYHPFGFTYLDSTGRVRKKRIRPGTVVEYNSVDVIEELRKKGIRIQEYEEVTTAKNRSCIGKLCAVVDYDDFERIVAVFIAEKLFPLL
jgi:hypothetical protein